MKISELIEQLKSIQEVRGDLQCVSPYDSHRVVDEEIETLEVARCDLQKEGDINYATVVLFIY